MSKKLGEYRYEYLILKYTVVLRAIATKTNEVITVFSYPKYSKNTKALEYAHYYVHKKAQEWAIENQYESEEND